MSNWLIGVDLGASKIVVGLVSPTGELVGEQRFATEAARGPDFAVARIASAAHELATAASVHVAAAGVCSPGPVDHVAGIILDPPNLGWRNVPFRQLLQDRLRVPVVLEHDAKAAALGEFYFGAGKQHGVRDLAYIIVGTGVGAAIVLDGALYRGRHNSAGELGHITLDRAGEPGSSGVPGCVESFISGPHLAKAYARLTGEANVSGQDVIERAAGDDEAACRVMADAGDALGAAAATLAMLVDVDFFVVGGGVSRAGELLLAPARAAVPKYAFASVAQHVRIVATTLHETAPVLGCAWQANQLLNNQTP